MKRLQRLVIVAQRFGVPMQSRVQAAQGIHVVAFCQPYDLRFQGGSFHLKPLPFLA
jgi:hypothetical protein